MKSVKTIPFNVIHILSDLSKILNHGPDHHSNGAPQTVQQGLDQTGQEVHQARQERVPEDRDCHSHWFRVDGVHRVLCQAHPHPHQQHHCRSLESEQQQMFKCYILSNVILVSK